MLVSATAPQSNSLQQPCQQSWVFEDDDWEDVYVPVRQESAPAELLVYVKNTFISAKLPTKPRCLRRNKSSPPTKATHPNSFQ